MSMLLDKRVKNMIFTYTKEFTRKGIDDISFGNIRVKDFVINGASIYFNGTKSELDKEVINIENFDYDDGQGRRYDILDGELE